MTNVLFKKEAIISILTVLFLITNFLYIETKSGIKSGVVRMDGRVYSCQEWDYYPTKGKKK